MSFPYIIQGNNLVVVIDNTPHTISKSHISYNHVVEAIKKKEWETVRSIITPAKMILQYGQGRVAVQGDKFFWDNVEMHNALSEKIIQMLQEGFDVEPMVNFIENLNKNPSHRAVNELYDFLEKGNLPITSDGCFLAYKKVRGDYYDVHSKTVLNKPASLMSPDEVEHIATQKFGKMDDVTIKIVNGNTEISMPRNHVDDDKDNTCSAGLHFCSIDYLSSFSGERTVILKINPRDVVSIPSDYKHTKGRTSVYEVIGELGVKPEEVFTSAVQDTLDYGSDEEIEVFWPQS